jgi:hypothetical protein
MASATTRPLVFVGLATGLAVTVLIGGGMLVSQLSLRHGAPRVAGTTTATTTPTVDWAVPVIPETVDPASVDRPETTPEGTTTTNPTTEAPAPPPPPVVVLPPPPTRSTVTTTRHSPPPTSSRPPPPTTTTTPCKGTTTSPGGTCP